MGIHTSEIGPLVGLLEEASPACSLGAPHDTGGGSCGIESGMGEMAVVRKRGRLAVNNVSA